MRVFKFRSRLRGPHVLVDVFVGPDADHLVNAGELCFGEPEWQRFKEMCDATPRARVLFEDRDEDPELVAELADALLIDIANAGEKGLRIQSEGMLFIPQALRRLQAEGRIEIVDGVARLRRVHN